MRLSEAKQILKRNNYLVEKQDNIASERLQYIGEIVSKVFGTGRYDSEHKIYLQQDRLVVDNWLFAKIINEKTYLYVPVKVEELAGENVNKLRIECKFVDVTEYDQDELDRLIVKIIKAIVQIFVINRQTDEAAEKLEIHCQGLKKIVSGLPVLESVIRTVNFKTKMITENETANEYMAEFRYQDEVIDELKNHGIELTDEELDENDAFIHDCFVTDVDVEDCALILAQKIQEHKNIKETKNDTDIMKNLEFENNLIYKQLKEMTEDTDYEVFKFYDEDLNCPGIRIFEFDTPKLEIRYGYDEKEGDDYIQYNYPNQRRKGQKTYVSDIVNIPKHISRIFATL